jgi:hypothetical protein
MGFNKVIHLRIQVGVVFKHFQLKENNIFMVYFAKRCCSLSFFFCERVLQKCKGEKNLTFFCLCGFIYLLCSTTELASETEFFFLDIWTGNQSIARPLPTQKMQTYYASCRVQIHGTSSLISLVWQRIVIV